MKEGCSLVKGGSDQLPAERFQIWLCVRSFCSAEILSNASKRINQCAAVHKHMCTEHYYVLGGHQASRARGKGGGQLQRSAGALASAGRAVCWLHLHVLEL